MSHYQPYRKDINMKKLVALMLTGALAFSLSTGALADEGAKSPDNDMVVALQADANLLISHFHFLHELKPRLKRCRRLC